MASTSQAEPTVTKVPRGWFRPFVAFLEERQHEWNSLEDDAAKQAFLRETKADLKESVASKVESTLLPKDDVIKVVGRCIFSFLTFQLSGLNCPLVSSQLFYTGGA